jgi:hypothetical protein|nr:MAG TPA: hypothetical protein [Caudoviricetes sp.]
MPGRCSRKNPGSYEGLALDGTMFHVKQQYFHSVRRDHIVRQCEELVRRTRCPEKGRGRAFFLAGDYGIEQVRARKILRDSLLEEQAGLLKRLEEIKKLLEEQQ